MENENQNKDQKVKEYESMLKKLYKDQDVEKLKALASEYKQFDPESKRAMKWQERADKLANKLAKKESASEKKGGFLSSLFKKKAADEGVQEETKEEAPKEEAKSMTSEAPAVPAAPKMAVAPSPAAQAPMTAPSQPAQAPAMPAAPAAPAAPAMGKPTMGPAAPAMPKAPEAPAVTKPEVAKAAPAAAPAAKTPGEGKPAKGNIFTSIFGKKEEAGEKKSIIDTIVAKTDEKKKEEKTVKKEKKIKVKREGGAVNLLKFSQVFMNFVAIFVVLSAGFLYVDFIDKGNTVLGLMGIPDNTGSRLVKAEDLNAELEREKGVLEKEIELYKSGYEDKALDTVQNIVETRVNWPDIFAKIKQVTDSVYELNDFFKYIEYNNYAFDAERGTVRVTGTLSDPLGRNLTRLVELEEAFKYYPKDKNNPDDPTQPFFTDFREFTSFSKTLDASTGRYTSTFQLSFALNK